MMRAVILSRCLECPHRRGNNLCGAVSEYRQLDRKLIHTACPAWCPMPKHGATPWWFRLLMLVAEAVVITAVLAGVWQVWQRWPLW